MIFTVFQYTSGKNEKNAIVFTWGLAEHGALGEREFLKPTRPGRRPVEYMHRPYRLGFAAENDVGVYCHKLDTTKKYVNKAIFQLGYRYCSWLWILSFCCKK